MDEVEEREGLAAYYLESFRGRIWDKKEMEPEGDV